MPSNRQQFLKLIGQRTGAPGRALKYDPSFCNRIQTMARRGQFPEAWACEIGVTLETLRRWGHRHPEFRDAMAMSKLMLLDFWMQDLVANLHNPQVRVPLFRLIIQRFPAIFGKDPIDLCDWIIAPPIGAGDPVGTDTVTEERIKGMTKAEILAKLDELAERRRIAEEG